MAMQEADGLAEPNTLSAPARFKDSSSELIIQHVLKHGVNSQTFPHTADASNEAVTTHPGDDHGLPPSIDTPGQDERQLQPAYTATSTTTRRNANGSVSSVYSGNKIRYLKKDDGLPLWRQDIQYKFLKLVFEDDRKVFTLASDGTAGHTFSDIYIDAMAKSSKTSQILKDKLLNDRAAAVSMAMICLLVNVGRMNTTLNFFPEMRARVRTYHSIPCLQAHQSSSAYKQLQDGPRLKSILKGATEDTEQPGTIEQIRSHARPRTNPVNLIFVFSQYAPKLSEIHMQPPFDFFDLFMKTSLSSESRASAFLWLIWWYLESDFSREASENNPFGKGQGGDDGGVPVKLPAFEVLTDEEAVAENLDTPEELAYGESKRLEREAIVNNEIVVPSIPRTKGVKRTKYSPFGTSASDSEERIGQQRSQSPRNSLTERLALSEAHHVLSRTTPSTGGRLLAPSSSTRIEGEDAALVTAAQSRRVPSRSNWARNLKDFPGARAESAIRDRKTRHHSPALDRHNQASYDRHTRDHDPDPASSPPPGEATATNGTNDCGPHGYYLPLSGGAPTQSASNKRSRPLTAHQQAMEASRRERVEYILDKNIRELQGWNRQDLHRCGVVVDAWIKTCELPDGWDSEMDGRDGQMGGISDVLRHDLVEDDIGERTRDLARGFKRVARVLDGIKIGDPVSRKRRRTELVDDAADSGHADEAETPRAKRNYKRRPVIHTAEDDDATPGPRSGRSQRRKAASNNAARTRAPPGRGTRRSGASRTSGLSRITLAEKDATKVEEETYDGMAEPVEDEEIDDLDRELLGEVGREEDSPGPRGRSASEVDGEADHDSRGDRSDVSVERTTVAHYEEDAVMSE